MIIKNKRVELLLYIIIILVILITSLSGCDSENETNTNLIGNTPSNLSNMGLVAKSADWIYYATFKYPSPYSTC